MKANHTLEPAELYERARALSRTEFCETLDCGLLLLVRLQADSKQQVESLRRALIECPTDQGYTWRPRSEVTHSTTALRVTRAEIDALTLDTISPTRMALAKILKDPHYALPLRKRQESRHHDAERISVGRSHGCDIVVFHPTVSKIHAWLERDEAERVYISDAGSMNLTRVRNRILDPGELFNVGYCEEILLGDVSVRITTAELLWDALQV